LDGWEDLCFHFYINVSAKTNYELQNRIRQLEKVSASLIEIVEGVSSERWNVDGFRLKDTTEWVEFYVTVRKSK
jgi:hypothetical protein